MSYSPRNSKVFGIGLSKTGTSSLAKALTILGFNTIHYPHDRTTLNELRINDLNLSILSKYQAITDISIAPYYRELDALFPDSKFILTVREKDNWLTSIEKHFTKINNWASKSTDFRNFTGFITAEIYSTNQFDENRLAEAYDRHIESVQTFFRRRPNRLLTMDIFAGDDWSVLVPFLEVSQPVESFPHSNSVKEMSFWIDRCDVVASELEEAIETGQDYVLIDDNKLPPDLVKSSHCIPFTELNGRYQGMPADDDQAIGEIERHRRNGVQFIAVLWPAFWIYDVYGEFSKYLGRHCDVILRNERVNLFRLN